MYETIGIITGAIGIGLYTILVIQCLCVMAADFVFERNTLYSDKYVWLYKIAKDSDADTWALGVLFVLLWCLGSVVWPLLYVVVSIVGLLHMLRGVVRSSKAAVAEHVKTLHKK